MIRKKLLPCVLPAALILCACDKIGGDTTSDGINTSTNSMSPSVSAEISANESQGSVLQSSTDSPDTSISNLFSSETQYNTSENPAANGDYDSETNLLFVTNEEGEFKVINCFFGGTGSEKYVKSLIEFKKTLPDTVNVYSMVIPNSSEYYVPLNFPNLQYSSENLIKETYDKLSSVGIKGVPVLQNLGNHKDEKIFLNTDHHWSALGAFYGAEALAQTAGISTFKPLIEYEKVVIPDFYGSYYTLSGKQERVKNATEDFIYYKPTFFNARADYYDENFKLSYDDGNIFVPGFEPPNNYSMFCNGDSYIVDMKTETKNGRKIAIFKDSYGNALPAFLTSCFEEVFLCDLRYFEPNAADFISENGITDVVVATNVFFSYGPNVKYMTTLYD